MPHDTYAAARNAAYTFPSPLYVSLIAACVDSRVWTAAPPPQVGGAQAMDPPAKLTSAQRALLHKIKEARAWYQGSDPDA